MLALFKTDTRLALSNHQQNRNQALLEAVYHRKKGFVGFPEVS